MPYPNYQQPSMFGSPAPQVGGMFGNVGRGLSPYSNRLLMAGMGMLSGNDPQEGFGNAMKGFAVGSDLDMTAADRKRAKADREKLDAALQGLANDKSGTGLLGSLSGAERDFMLASPGELPSVIAQRMKPRDAAGFGTTPIYGTDAEGNQAIMQLSQSGQPIRTPLPEGFKLGPGMEKMDLGTDWGILDRNGQLIERIPKDVAGAAAQQEIGQGQGQAQVSLPKVQSAATAMKNMIAGIRDDPNRASTTGWQSNLPQFGGSPRKSFQIKSDQLRGQAFLQAYEALRGAGTITQQEGAAATDAMTRVNTALSDEEYLTALDDLEVQIDRLVELAEQKVRGGAIPPGGGGMGTLKPNARGELDWSP